MPTGENQSDTDYLTISNDFIVEPLKGEGLKPILHGLENGVLYLTKLGQLKDTVNIVSKGTVLFDSDSIENSFENIVQSDGKYIASCNGLFILDEGKPKLVPASNNACLDVSIEENNMSASITFYPALENGKSMQVTDVLATLQKNGIKSGVNKNAILSSLAICSNRKQAVEDVVVASAKLPEKGEDGKIECTANWQVDSKPSVNKNGTLNFYEIHSVVAVSKGQIVGKIVPPKKGKHGFDIFNNPIEAKPGDEADISVSTNVYISDKDNLTIHSKIDGFLEFKNKIIHIKDQHVVSGDIDFHTGNISGNGSLKISGSVLNGFKLILRDDIEIGGNIGDSIVESGKDIIVKGGFFGTEHGKLKAGGDISIKYIENQSVYANGSLSFMKDILHSNVYVSKSIKGNGGNTCIIGGYTIAGDGIDVAQVGNDSGTKTIIELGYDFSLKEKIDANKQKIDHIFEIVKQMDQQLINFSAMKRLNPEQVRILKSIAEERKNYLAEIDELKQHNEELKKQTLETSSAYLKCTRKIFPGVTIMINGRKLDIKETMHSKSFQISKDGQITF